MRCHIASIRGWLHIRFGAKIWGEEPTREEVVEIGLSARPVALTELLAKIPCVPALERVGRAEHITVGYDISEGDIAALARVIPAGEYAVLEFRDAGARLLRFERDLIKVLTPHRTGRAARSERRFDPPT